MILSNMLSMSGGGSGSSGRNNKGTLTINLPKTNYLYGERFSLTGATIIFTPRRGNPIDVTEQVINSNGITPADNTVWDIAGEQTVRAVYVTTNGDEIYGKVVVNVAEEGKGYLAVTTSRNEYNHGDQFNTSVLSITFVKADGTETVIDPANVYVTTSPENGSTFEIDGPNTIIVSYDYAGESQSQTAINPAPAYVKITVKPVAVTLQLKLKQTGCKVHGIVIYDQSVITVTYSDGTQKQIIYGNNAEEDAKITWDPHERTTLDEAGETEVTATYTEHGYSISGSSYIKVTNATLKALTFTLGKTTFNAGDTIDLTDMGAAVVASYSDGSTRTVTKYCDISPSRGTWQVGDTKVTVTYEENDVSLSESKAIKVNDVATSLSVSISKTSYKVGESITYAGSLCLLRYSSGKEEDVYSGSVAWSPSEGTPCTAEGSVFVTATYKGLTARTSVSVSAATTTGKDANGNDIETTIKDSTDPTSNVVTIIPSSIEVDHAPSKTRYYDGEKIDFTGLALKLLDKDGERYTSDTGEDPYKRGFAYYKEKLRGTEFVFPTTIARISNASVSSGTLPYNKWNVPDNIRLTAKNDDYYRVCRNTSAKPNSQYRFYYTGFKVFAIDDPINVAFFYMNADEQNDIGGRPLFALMCSKGPFKFNKYYNDYGSSVKMEQDDDYVQSHHSEEDLSTFTYANRTVYFTTMNKTPVIRLYDLPYENKGADLEEKCKNTPAIPNINPYTSSTDGLIGSGSSSKAKYYAWKIVYGGVADDTDAVIPVSVPVEFNKFSKKYTTSFEILVAIGADGTGISVISGTDRTAFMQNLNALEADPTVEVVSTSQEETADGIVYTIRYRKIS